MLWNSSKEERVATLSSTVCAMANPPVSGGPRLGKLQGLRQPGDDESHGRDRSDNQKGGIKLVPLFLMFVMFGPVLLSGLVWAFDALANSELGVKIGLTNDPRTRLTKFYQKHNPGKMQDVDKLLRKYEGRYSELFKKLEKKYTRIDPKRKKQMEEEEEFLREQERYAKEEREAREAQEAF